jgi:hypothetical protein
MPIPRSILHWSLVTFALAPPTALFTMRLAEATNKASALPKLSVRSEPIVEISETELLKLQMAVDDLRNKARTGEDQIIHLVQRIKALEEKSIDSSTAMEVKKEFENAKKELDAAEREKTFLADRLAKSSERKTPAGQRKVTASGEPGIRGRVLAVNRGYNFVVIDLGARHGIEMNSEMLVLRGRSLIGKIRVSSVEPATTIGDIITNSLARGVQVQTGDTIVYAGTNF